MDYRSYTWANDYIEKLRYFSFLNPSLVAIPSFDATNFDNMSAYIKLPIFFVRQHCRTTKEKNERT